MPLVRKQIESKSSGGTLFDSPTELIVASFIVVILLGTLLLWLPFSTESGEFNSPLTALFTATSATCVTGLILEDTGSFYSSFGQTVIICLIQIGGLGLATITSFILSFGTGRHDWKMAGIAQESAAGSNRIQLWPFVRFIIFFTFLIEATGAYILSSYFKAVGVEDPVRKGVFQAISAFCNGGFDLHGTVEEPFQSLTYFAQDPVVLYTTAFLIIIGGIGFIVYFDLLRGLHNFFARLFKKSKDKWHPAYHSKVALLSCLILLASGTLIFFALEYNNTAHDFAMGKLSTAQKWHSAFFQSATARTAGFNSIDQGSLTAASKFIMCVYMFIGAAPAGTGGGIKTTTFMVFVAAVISYIKGSKTVSFTKRRFSGNVVSKALAIIGLGLFAVIGSTFLAAAFEASKIAAGRFQLIDLLYECTSAFATVGITSIGTANLSVGTQLIIIILMLVGRVGPLAFAISLVADADRGRDKNLVYPEGKILIG